MRFAADRPLTARARKPNRVLVSLLNMLRQGKKKTENLTPNQTGISFREQNQNKDDFPLSLGEDLKLKFGFDARVPKGRSAAKPMFEGLRPSPKLKGNEKAYLKKAKNLN